MRFATKKLARAATIATVIIALSGSLATGRPLFATLGDVAFKLTAGFSEVEEVRRKITEAHARRYMGALKRATLGVC
jgi:hypothetical protein